MELRRRISKFKFWEKLKAPYQYTQAVYRILGYDFSCVVQYLILLFSNGFATLHRIY